MRTRHEADERQYYLFRVQQKLYSRDQGAMSMAMLDRARWEHQAYYLAIGEASFTRLLSMWELYRSAFRSIRANNSFFHRIGHTK